MDSFDNKYLYYKNDFSEFVEEKKNESQEFLKVEDGKMLFSTIEDTFETFFEEEPFPRPYSIILNLDSNLPDDIETHVDQLLKNWVDSNVALKPDWNGNFFKLKGTGSRYLKALPDSVMNYELYDRDDNSIPFSSIVAQNKDLLYINVVQESQSYINAGTNNLYDILISDDVSSDFQTDYDLFVTNYNNLLGAYPDVTVKNLLLCNVNPNFPDSKLFLHHSLVAMKNGYEDSEINSINYNSVIPSSDITDINNTLEDSNFAGIDVLGDGSFYNYNDYKGLQDYNWFLNIWGYNGPEYSFKLI